MIGFASGSTAVILNFATCGATGFLLGQTRLRRAGTLPRFQVGLRQLLAQWQGSARAEVQPLVGQLRRDDKHLPLGLGIDCFGVLLGDEPLC